MGLYRKGCCGMVLVDTVFQSSATQYIKMYWGKSDAIAKSNSTAVFDTANGFRGVWHMNNAGRPDATPMNDSAQSKGAASTAGGVIAGCDTFVSASSQYDSIASGRINLANKNITVMAWFKMNNASPSSLYGILGQGPNLTGDQGLHLGYRYTTTRFTFAFYSDSWTRLPIIREERPGIWWRNYATSNKLQSLYMDGALDNSRTANGNFAGTGVSRIGNTYSGTGNYFGGNLDEIVVSDSTRSADWIKLCYSTHKCPARRLSGRTAPLKCSCR